MLADTAGSVGLMQLPLAEYIFGGTGAMQKVRESLEAALLDDLPVLIEGESGTGKELVARFLHLRSTRAAGPFIRVNCGALPARLLNREMFGQGCPSLEDRQEGSPGSVALAANGTLFLDEIGEMDAELQQKVVDVLNTGGSSCAVNARIVGASSVDLSTGMGGGRVSEGLSSRFKHRVRLSPLRERKQDIPHLCEYLVDKFARNFGRPAPQLNPEVLESFRQWNWPGNIRELENWIARIVIFGSDEAMSPEFRRQMGIQQGGGIARRHPVRPNLNRGRRARRHK